MADHERENVLGHVRSLHFRLESMEANKQEHPGETSLSTPVQVGQHFVYNFSVFVIKQVSHISRKPMNFEKSLKDLEIPWNFIKYINIFVNSLHVIKINYLIFYRYCD